MSRPRPQIRDSGTNTMSPGRRTRSWALPLTIAGSDTSAYQPGSEYAVKVDPENRQNLTFAPQG